MDILMAGNGYPVIATHDQQLIEYAKRAATSNQRVADSWEFQMLYGVRPGEQARLAREGYKVRIYVPFGPDWFPDLTRRLAEKPTNPALFARSLVSCS